MALLSVCSRTCEQNRRVSVALCPSGSRRYDFPCCEVAQTSTYAWSFGKTRNTSCHVPWSVAPRIQITTTDVWSSRSCQSKGAQTRSSPNGCHECTYCTFLQNAFLLHNTGLERFQGLGTTRPCGDFFLSLSTPRERCHDVLCRSLSVGLSLKSALLHTMSSFVKASLGYIYILRLRSLKPTVPSLDVDSVNWKEGLTPTSGRVLRSVCMVRIKVQERTS